jgi:DnaB-like helicase N terminal domain
MHHGMSALAKRRAATEAALLGGALMSHGAFARIKDRLAVADFSTPFHQQVFRAMLDTERAGHTIDTATLMVTDPMLDSVKLVLLDADGPPTSANIEHFATQVRQAAGRQRVLDMAANLEFANNEFWNHTRELGASLAELEASPMLRVRSAADFASETPATIQWIAEPLIVAGAITELSGKVKRGGKTTFLHGRESWAYWVLTVPSPRKRSWTVCRRLWPEQRLGGSWASWWQRTYWQGLAEVAGTTPTATAGRNSFLTI